MSATAFFGQSDEAASPVHRRRMDLDEAVALEETKHLPHRGPLDIEAFRKRVHRDVSGFTERRQSKELRDAQPRGFEMGVIEARDLPSGLPRSKAVALIDPKRLMDLHPFDLSFP